MWEVIYHKPEVKDWTLAVRSFSSLEEATKEVERLFNTAPAFKPDFIRLEFKTSMPVGML